MLLSTAVGLYRDFSKSKLSRWAPLKPWPKASPVVPAVLVSAGSVHQNGWTRAYQEPYGAHHFPFPIRHSTCRPPST